MKNMFKTMIVISAFAFSSIASAALVSIDFGTGIGTGGTVVYDGTDAVGTNIAINAVNVADATDNDGGYSAVALLNFDTAAGTISVTGTMGVDALTGLTVSQDLFSGTIDTWSYAAGTISIFEASGAGVLSEDLANFIGEPINQVYEYMEFSLNIGDDTRSTDLLLTVGGDRDIPQVPVPAAAWLFGSGLLGLVGVARRKV